MGDGSMKGNNWATNLSNDSRKALILALQCADLHDVFKRSRLYIDKGGQALIHLDTTIRKSQVDSALIGFDWMKVKGSIAAILKKMGSVETFRFDKVIGSKSFSGSTVRGPNKKMNNNRIPRSETAEHGSASAKPIASADTMNAEYSRLEASLSLQIEEKRKISQQFLRVYAAFFDESRCDLIDSNLSQQMADSMIENLDKADQEFVELSAQLTVQVELHKELGHRYRKMESAKQALEASFDKLSKEQSIQQKKYRRALAERKPWHGWSKPASSWTNVNN
jgi:hypothetical protein